VILQVGFFEGLRLPLWQGAKSCLTVLLPQAMHLLAFEISKWEFVRHFDPISAAAMLLQMNAVVFGSPLNHQCRNLLLVVTRQPAASTVF
jgi:hypothetical protein